MQISCFVLGNCQGQFISSALASLPGWETFAVGRRFGFDPSVGSRKPQYASLYDFWPLVQEAKRNGRFCLILEQLTPQAPERTYGSREVLFDKKIYFPHVQSQALWPARYFRPDVIEHLNVGRLLAQDLASIKKAQTKSAFPVDVHAWVKENFPRQPLFHTWGHPNGPLIALVLDGILQQLDGIVSSEQRAELVSLVGASAGIDNLTNHPIDPQWLAGSGFEWATSPAYVGWSEAVALYKRGDSEASIERARASLTADDANGYVWSVLAQGLERLKLLPEAEGAYRQAIEKRPHAPSLQLALGRFLLRHRMPYRALRVADAAVAMFPLDTSAYLLAMETNIRLGTTQAARLAAVVGAERGHPHSATFIRMLDALKAAGLTGDVASVREVMMRRLPKDQPLKDYEV